MTNPLKTLFSPEALASFRYTDFRKFIFSKFLLTLALQMQFVVLSWQVYEITKDPLSLGLLGLAEAIPAVCLALYGGHVADRNDRRIIMMIGCCVMIALSIGLTVLSIYYSGDRVLHTALPFYALMFIIGMVRAFYGPAQFSFMAMVIPRENYANSSVWNSTIWHIAVVLGSSAGGLLLGVIGKPFTYLMVTALFCGTLIQLIRIKAKPFEKVHQEEEILESIKAGVQFLFGNKIMLGAMMLDLVAVLFGGAIAMLPVFASDILHVGERGFGILRAAPFAGAVIIALYMTSNPPVKNSGRKLLICVTGFAVCMILFALSKNFYLSFFILVLSGCFDNVSVVIRSTILQMLTPENMRGRVSSVSTMFITSSNELGAFESGFAAKLMGLIPSVIFGGGIAIMSVAAAAIKVPELRKLQLHQEKEN